MKLALGTVQFGLDYGVSNQRGQVTPSQIEQILSLAKQHGINTLDSAAAYGDSEQRLGEQASSQQFHIVTKVPTLGADVQDIRPYFERSLTRLKRDRLDALLFHDADTILTHPNSEQFCQQIREIKHQDLVKRIGISVYHPEQIKNALNKLSFDLVQAPVNVFDQRFVQADVIKLLSQHGLTLHARSAFLQGLLLMSKGSWPAYFKPYFHLLTRFSDVAKQYKISKLTLALAFMVHNSLNNLVPEKAQVLEKIVVGCCTAEQLAEIIASYQAAKAIELPQHVWRQFACTEPGLINPARWST